ncbi:MAG: AAA family ATPase [Gammaproteobacteria bacterium]
MSSSQNAKPELPKFYSAEEFLALPDDEPDDDALEDDAPFADGIEFGFARNEPENAHLYDALANVGQTAQGAPKLLRLDDLAALPEPLWLVKDLIPAAGRLVGLSGFAGVGKTFAALDLALSVACGVPWLGRDVLRSQVIFIPLEGLGDMKPRIDAWLVRHHGQAFRYQVRRYFHVLPTSMALDNLNLQIFPGLKNLPCGTLIIIDTFTRALSTANENDASELRPVMNRLRKLANDAQATIMLLQHTPWDAKRERGSTAIRGEMDASLHLDRDSNGLVLKNLKQRAGQEQDPISCRLAPVLGTKSAVFELADTRAELKEATLRHEIAMIVREQPGVSLRKTIEMLRECGMEFDDKLVRQLYREASVVERGEP